MIPSEDYPIDFMNNDPPKDHPLGGSQDYWTFAAVEERLIEAWEFLQRLPMGGASPFAADGPWSQIIRDPLVDYVDREEIRERNALRSAEVDRMNEALGWIEIVPPRGSLRRIIGFAIAQQAHSGSRVDWREVKRRSGDKNTCDALRMSYSRSITLIANALNRRNAQVQVSTTDKCMSLE